MSNPTHIKMNIKEFTNKIIDFTIKRAVELLGIFLIIVSILDAFIKAGKGHVGGALSCIEIIRVLYDDIMNYRPKNPLWHDRDRFILSKVCLIIQGFPCRYCN